MLNVALNIGKDVSRTTTFALKVHYFTNIIIFTKMAQLQLSISLKIVNLHSFLLHF